MNSRTYKKSLECERNILSILLTDSKKMQECFLEEKHFLNEENRNAYRIFRKCYEKYKHLDMTVMCQMLKNESKQSRFMEFCMSLFEEYVSSGNFDFYIEMQENYYREAKTKEIAEKMLNGDIELDDAVNEIQKAYSEIVKTNDEYLPKTEDIYQLITNDSSELKFVKFSDTQKKIGFLEHTVNVIAARPQIGKTGFALNLLNDLAENYKCIYFNMEMTEKEIHQRLTGINSGVPIYKYKALYDDDEIKKVKSGIDSYSRKRIKIYNGSLYMKSLKKIVAREQKEDHVIVFIDHVGYVKVDKARNDTERIGEVVREIQTMTKDLNCTVFLLCHVNRTGTDDPKLENLKDSGELEQSAHTVLILNNMTEEASAEVNEIEVKVSKNRSGKRGKLKYKYFKNNQRFVEEFYER